MPIARYLMTYRVADKLTLPPFEGSAWRGAFGHALKHALCVTQIPECHDCPMLHNCGYSYVFETPVPPSSTKMRRYPSVPHPFVFDIYPGPRNLTPNSPYKLGITLIGHGNDHFSSILHALEQAGIRGIGVSRGRLILEQVSRYNDRNSSWEKVTHQERNRHPSAVTPVIPTIPAPAERVRVNIKTPLRLKQQSRIVKAEEFSFAVLFGSLLRRVSMLTYFHTDQPLETDFAELTRVARSVSTLQKNLKWRSIQRHSSRQQRHIQTGGLIGSFELAGSGLAQFWPYIVLGQYVHAGAASSMGMGAYDVECIR